MADRYLHGFHDEGGEALHRDKPGWTVVSVEVGLNGEARGFDWSHIANKGIGVVIRLNYSHQGQGTLPLPNDYQRFAAACQSFVATSRGVWGWIIGNEPNHEGERPQGQVITPQDYIRAYKLSRDAIKRADSTARVSPAAIAPYHASPLNWLDYARIVYHGIGSCDFFALHAYARSMAPESILSSQKMDAPLQSQFNGFRTFEDALSVVPIGLKSRPALITEFNVIPEWLNQNTGIVRAMYTYLHSWNVTPGNQPVIGATLFRWLGPPDVDNGGRNWGVRENPNILADFEMAVAQGYKSPLVHTHTPTAPGQIFIPEVIRPEKEGPAMPPIQRNITRDFMTRTKHGIHFVPGLADQSWYALISADYYPPPEGASTFGPDHHMLVEVLDLMGRRKMGQQVIFQEGDKATPKVIDKPSGPYGVDLPMFRPGYGYGVYVGGEGQMSDYAFNMGLGTIDQPDWNHHVTYHLVFQEMRGLAQAPTQPVEPPITTQPTQPAPPATVPRLAHPVADARYRRVSQVFGARPEYYSQFMVGGVPLLGHEGIDFATPTGTPIQAVDAGRVTEALDQGDKGYGKYVKVIHLWGESVYAHLSQHSVKGGDMVQRGQVIGLSGWSGNVDPKGPNGAHLHFGLRVNPYNRQDGWGGYSNPAPFLSNVLDGPEPVQRPPQPGAGLSQAEIVKIILGAADEAQVNRWLLLSLIHAESSLNPLSENPGSGARGLGQLMPNTWAEWSAKIGVSNVFDARDNARVTAFYLEWAIAQMGGHERRGLWAYIMGPTGAKEAIASGSIPVDVQTYASKIIHGKEVILWSRL